MPNRIVCQFSWGAASADGMIPLPPAAAEAIAQVMGTTLLLAAQGETFMLSSMPIWVRPVAVGLSVSPSSRP